jgi:hyperosmotically inducible periplasmic protein
MKTTYGILLMMAAVALVMTGAPARASEMDDRIESSAKNSYVFKTYLQGDDIKL